jgi:hypothetical protein
MARGCDVLVLGLRDRETHPAHGALVLDLDVDDRVRIDLGRAAGDEQPDAPSAEREDGNADDDRDGRPNDGVEIDGLDPLEDRAVGHATALTHGLQSVPGTGALHLVDEGRHDLGA